MVKQASWISMVGPQMFWQLLQPQLAATGSSLQDGYYSPCVWASQLPWQDHLSSSVPVGLLPVQ